MATIDTARERPLFVRKATGLVKGWSAYDAFIYAFITVNPVVLGLYIFSFGPFIAGGSLFWAVIVSSAFILFEVIVYAGLISVMPRAGGDYVWQSRILHGSIGFVLAATGWWFILWHWVPIYANIMVIELFNPLLAIAGADGLASWLTGSDGVFASALLLIAIITGYCALGMRGYAKVQRVCFYGGLAGFVVVLGLLLFNDKNDFITAFDRGATSLYGADDGAYAATLSVAGVDAPFLQFTLSTMLLAPMALFWNMWPNWGATMYGEVRGATDFRKNLAAMGGALLFATALALILFGLIAKTMGWDFYNASNNAYWGTVYGYTDNAPLSAWPYPVMLASWLVNSEALQFLLITVVGLWFLGTTGVIFLSSTRVVFAAAFDRILPEWAAKVTRNGVPIGALALMAIPSVVVAALYAYWGTFVTYTLDAVLVLVVTYLGSAVAAALLPWRARRIYEISPLARWKVRGVPLITVAAAIFGGFLVYALVLWLKDDAYGVNNTKSLVYMGLLYGLALVIFVGAALARRRQGLSVRDAQREIPVE